MSVDLVYPLGEVKKITYAGIVGHGLAGGRFGQIYRQSSWMLDIPFASKRLQIPWAKVAARIHSLCRRCHCLTQVSAEANRVSSPGSTSKGATGI